MTKELFKRAKKRSMRDRWNNWGNKPVFNGKFSPRAKYYVIGFLLILSILGSNLFLGNVFHPPVYPNRVFQQGPDPTVIVGTRLFHILLPNGDTSEFNTFVPNSGQIAITNCATFYEASSKCVDMIANSTHAAIALTKAPFSVSSAASNNLVLSQFWATFTMASSTNQVFGWYLTTNKTVPTSPNYDPNLDSSVFLNSAVFCISSCNTNTPSVQAQVLMLRNIGDTLSGEDTGCGPNSGSRFFCNVQTDNITLSVSNYLQLNYTGFTNIPPSVNCSTSPSLKGSGCSFFQNFGPTPSQNGIVSTTFLPPFKIQAHEFYYGLYVRPSASGLSIQFGTDNNNDDFCCGIKSFNGAEITNGVTTAGFFQPLVDALVATSAFLLAGVAQFFNVVFVAFKVALDTMGNFLGIGAIGTQLANAFSEFATWVTSVFSTGFLIITNAVSFLVNSLTAITNTINTYWGLLTSFLSDLSSFLSGLWTVLGAFLQYGSIAFKFGLVIFWVIGMSMAYRDIKLFMLWTRMAYMFVLYPFKIGMFFYDHIIEKVLLRAKMLIFDWL